MNDAELLAEFAKCRLPSIDHEDHVRIAWATLKTKPLYSAIGSLVEGFRRFAEAKGKPEVYHETITWAFVVMINERIEQSGKDCDWEAFKTEHSDLFNGRTALNAFYQKHTLDSDLARRTFVLPDRIKA